MTARKACCIKPDQFVVGLAVLLNAHPECQSRLKYSSDSKVSGTCNSILVCRKQRPDRSHVGLHIIR